MALVEMALTRIALLALALLACSDVLPNAARAAAVRLLDHGDAPPVWRYRVLGPVVGQACGSLVIMPEERDARADLRAQTTLRGGHAVLDIRCRPAGIQPFCWTSLRCEGTAVQWLPGQ